jgi:hypothetical protein
MGYEKAFSMKWGMSSWNEFFATGYLNAGANGNAYTSQFTSEATAKGPAGDMPTLTTGKETGQEILEARLAAVLAEGFGLSAVAPADVFGALDAMRCRREALHEGLR